MMENNKKGVFLVLLTAIISGFAVFINKLGVSGVDPFFYTYIKNAIAGVAVISIIFLFKKRGEFKNLSKEDKIKLFWIAFIGGAIPFLLFFKGLSMTAAFKAGFVHKTMFIYVGILALVFLKEKITKAMMLGILSLAVGSFLFLQVKPQVLNLGDLYVLIAALLWSAEIIISKKVLKNISGITVALARLLGGSFFILAFLALTGRMELFSAVNFGIVEWGIIGGVILALYNITFYSGLKYIGATEATAIMTLAVPITGILSAVFLDVSLTGWQLFGTALIVLGIIFVSGVVRKALKLNKLLIKRKADELA
ncbi:MAG: hypothetical protein A2373_02980 [Candidatus Magasanikbacteria bacterium RIFOXYB1_FULL_40_15]|uniref:EamA domain-containing protein n=2 Tax=Candidatus Magasanikiibacteriota TaxID=1752731 RepID=A0A1F6NEW9_9BACT|nr:MAG: hypothetical protein A2224_03920 [Candidatus Magasanikbacteria bacterium RIFOXYA2_FULL_40_20]OGH82371.1 MAG: hypothetical protein A2373_02980 [Candidatus Magasanikbacteria bacterium RIFOXYB1_FULL_40_15]